MIVGKVVVVVVVRLRNKSSSSSISSSSSSSRPPTGKWQIVMGWGHLSVMHHALMNSGINSGQR